MPSCSETIPVVVARNQRFNQRNNMANKTGNGHFRVGNPGGPGGIRPGAGRPANWMRSLCDDIIWKNQLAEQMGNIASGKAISIKYQDPNTMKMSTAIRIPTLSDMMAATAWLADRAHGKPRQANETPASNTIDISALAEIIQESRKQRGLDTLPQQSE